MNRRFLLPLSLFCVCSVVFSQSGFVPAFKLHPNDLELTRPAQPFQYFDKIGKRAGLMGYESGTFEAWVWPWKPLRNFELSFLLGTSTQPILARDIVRTISVTPEATVLTYTYESFTVKEFIVVPRDETGVILLLDVYSTSPITIVAGFLPVMQPMWPAGIGGQFSYWDDDAHAYVISEGQWRAVFLCGSPLAQQMAAPPAHMFADNPLQFKIDVKPNETTGKFIPIVIAGSPVKTKMDSVKATYNRLWTNAVRYYEENYDYYQNLRNSTIQVITPNKEFNLAYEWGKVALDNLMITNPTLGTGMVAGFGLSGGGARPGFAWFFGGDAFINSLAMTSYGDYSKVRDALSFTQKWQRQEDFPIRKKNSNDPPTDVGKMAHELSQSDGLCDWWNDYHYGYNHADTTPWYIVAMGDYVRSSGDVDFLQKSWKSVKQAYEWCLTKDTDGDGLMDLKGAGLGALEFGKLVGIYADVYTCGVWVQAIKEMGLMAEIVGDTAQQHQSFRLGKIAQPQLERKFWMEKEGFYAYGATDKGEQVHEKTPWSGVGLMFGLFDSQHSRMSMVAFSGADLCTDWGVRTLSRSSSLFEPTNYNYGATWPFISSFVNTAQFKHGFGLAGIGVLQSVTRHVFDNGLGVVPEVFSGELNQKLGEAYHHQGFSTTGYMLPFVRGLIGLEVDATNTVVSLSPSFPADWRSVDIRHVTMGKNLLDLRIVQTDSSISLQPYSSNLASISIVFEPKNFLPNDLNLATLDGVPLSVTRDLTSSVMMRTGSELTYVYKKQPAILPPAPQVPTGTPNASLKIISYTRNNNATYTLRVEGLRGKYLLKVVNPDQIQSVSGAELLSSALVFVIEVPAEGEFSRKDIVISTK
jgi:glycogen debranching enzyme